MSIDVQWTLWEAGSGHLSLSDGTRVFVKAGDEILYEYDEDANTVLIHDHKAKMSH